MRPLIFVAALLLGLAAAGSGRVAAHHQTYLPLVPNTPLMKSIKATQEYTWCVNARAANYPKFTDQVREVSDEYTRRTGIRHRQVAHGPDCQVQHNMPESHGCSGCAAWVYYANWPVVIEYRWQVGYVLWQTTIGHELGHALLGLHEQYIDLGSIQCTGRQDTVMDCGSGVRYPTERDIALGCSQYMTVWCGFDGFQTCSQGSGDPRWDDCLQPPRWVFSDGWSVDPVSGWWYDPAGRPAWTACNQDGLRWDLWDDQDEDGVIDGFGGKHYPPGSSFFDPKRGYWAASGPC